MRILALMAAATLVLVAAAPAAASDDTTNVQINRLTGQISLTNLQNLNVDGHLNFSAGGIGNSISMVSETTATPANLNDTRVASVQFNQGTIQLGLANLVDVDVDGRLDGSVQAVGNAASFESVDNDISSTAWGLAAVQGVLAAEGFGQAALISAGYPEGFSAQVNQGTLQIAGANLRDVSVGGRTDVAATAAGNSVEFTARDNASAVNVQLNTATLQLAGLNVNNSDFGGHSAFQTQAIGNIASWTGNSADGINFQGNIGTIQGSLTNIVNSGFGANLNAGSISVGNVANIRSVNLP